MSNTKKLIERVLSGACNMGWISDAEAEEIRAIAAPSAANGAEMPELPEPLEIYWPTLNRNALGCGVEDRAIHCRYGAAEYGWEDGVDKAIECVPEAIYDAEQLQACARAAVLAERAACAAICDRGVEKMVTKQQREGAARCASIIRART